MEITQITLIETGDFNFKVSFLVDGHNLETGELPRTIKPEEVDEVIKETANAWLAQRGNENFALIKKRLEAKSISLIDEKIIIK
jgi:hypothetical protein